jgi:YggT family protein
MSALHYLISTLFSLYTVVLLLRLILQLVRADFRNSLSRAIVQITNPVVLPLRKVLPPAGRIDTASVAAILLVTLLKIWVLALLFGAAPGLALLLRTALLDVIVLVLQTYQILIIVNALLSFVAPGNYSPVQALLSAIVDPVLNPFRRIIPPIAGLDLSPLWAILLIGVLLRLL